MPTSDLSQPFASTVADYALAGWSCILPVPPVTKTPPPVGFTGDTGADTDPITLATWVGTDYARYSVALRMPPGVIGIDVDEYEKGSGDHVVTKHGAATLAAYVERWGPLPATWSSTSRGGTYSDPGPSRIMLFRVPAQRYATKLGADIEIIQRHHRYAVVWPSVHHLDEAGLPVIYRWYDPAGVVTERPPRIEELAQLPEAWVAGLAAGATEAAAASSDVESGRALLDQLESDWREECAEVTSARMVALDALSASSSGTRHDAMIERTHHLVQLAAHGHTGVARAIAELREAWCALTAGEDRAEEYERALLTTARKAVTGVGAVQVPRDPCFMVAGFPVPPTAPGDPAASQTLPDGTELQIAEPPRWLSMREIIGTAAFDPRADLDQPLAEAVLARVFPALRYAYDVNAWLLRTPERWELHGRMSPWAVAQVAPLMPMGDITAEKGSDPHARAARRARLLSTAGGRAVAGKMDDLVAGGMHPAGVALADLDANADVLWAGGMPYSLRASHDGPAFADASMVDVSAPHLHSAAVRPQSVPTPAWDAFVAAVWPDPELRAWAIRVLSIAVTGYADRAIPILLGETGRGKTQVIALMMSVLGSYAHAANPKLLSASSNEHDTIVFDLKGRRLSFIDEAPSDAKAGQERLKQLTGGGDLTGRQMNQDPVTFRPTHTLVLTANDEPTLTDPAVRSRTRLIPCEGDPEAVRQARAAIGHVSGPVWRAEAPGVLAALMAQAARWLAEPTSALVTAAPESIRYLAEHLGAEQDPVAVWLAEETEIFETGTPSRELYQAFVASCRRNSMRTDAIPSETKWGRTLTRLGVDTLHTKQGKRRPLRVRTTGFLPGMAPVTGSDSQIEVNPSQRVSPTPLVPPPSPAPVIGDGLSAIGDGLVTGSRTNPSPAKTQVSPDISPGGDGCDGLNSSLRTHTRAHAHVNSRPESALNPSPETGAQPGEPPYEPAKPKRQRSPEAIARAEAAKVERQAARELEKAEKRAAAIATAAGGFVVLPALVMRDGSTRSIDLADADALLTTITSSDAALTVDVEHTGYPTGHRNFALRTIQLGNDAFAIDFDAAAQDQVDVVRRHLATAHALHAHVATADLVPLGRAGILDLDAAWARMYDTSIPSKLADPSAETGLKELASAVLGESAVAPRADTARSALFKAGGWRTDVEPNTELEKSGWAQVDPSAAVMVRYAASDVLDTAALGKVLTWPEPHTLERERTTLRMVSRVSEHGLRIDGERVQHLLAEQRADQAEAGEKLRAFGIENPGSDQQVGAALERLGVPLPRTATGKPSVAKAAIEVFSRDQGPVGDLVRARLAYQIPKNRIGLFLNHYEQAGTNGDGRVYPTIYTLGARTGRMSCVRPNVQQVPRAGGFRACLTADPGEVLISADFAGVELRVAAALSQDDGLAAIMADPARDLHWEIARIAFGPNATKADRYAIKRGVFGRIYGGGVAAVAKGVGVREPVAQLVIDAMDQLTPRLTQWSHLIKDGVRIGRTRFETYDGRVIHLPAERGHAAPNYCIQGTARELLIDALMRWSTTKWGSCVMFPVHDELVVKVPEDDAAEALATLTELMTNELYGVPIIAEPSEPGYAWKDSE